MIKNRDFKIIDMLEKIAIDIAPIKSARIASAIVYNKRIVSVGINQNKTHTMQHKYARNNRCGHLLHSEIHSIAQALRRISVSHLADSTLYICRTKYTAPREHGGKMQWGLAKPCNGCQNAIKGFGICRVVYTTDDQTLEELI